MEIKSSAKDFKVLNKLFYKAKQMGILDDKWKINLDEKITVSVIMVWVDGKPQWFTSGKDNICSFLTTGIVYVRRYCPLIKRKCKGNKCSFYIIKGNTGDCEKVWNCL